MNPVPRPAAVLLVLGAAAGCGGTAPAAARKGPLPAGVVARVDGRPVPLHTAERIARAQHMDIAHAVDAAVRDALLAREAEARGLASAPETRLAVDVELARRVLRRMLEEARATPPTEAELDSAAARRWLEVDRPEGFRTVHAVAMFAPTDPEEKKARGRALASAIRRAVEPAIAGLAAPLDDGAPLSGPRVGPTNDPDPLSAAFRQAALAVTAEGIEVRVEPLPAVSAGGRVLQAGDLYLAEQYSRAAASLSARGALSPVVESPFGAHVILLLEKTPASVLVGEARTAKLRDDIVNERARAAQKRLLTERRVAAEVLPDAVGLLSLVRVNE